MPTLISVVSRRLESGGSALTTVCCLKKDLRIRVREKKVAALRREYPLRKRLQWTIVISLREAFLRSWGIPPEQTGEPSVADSKLDN